MNKNAIVHHTSLPLIIFGVVVGFIYLFQIYRISFLRAKNNILTFKIKMQGERYPQSIIKADIVMYNPHGKVKEFINSIFRYEADNIFTGEIVLDAGFDYNTLYAAYIKPNNHFGQLFCSESIRGKECISPQFIVKQTNDVIDVSKYIFFGGDISPTNGKVDAYDLSKIMSNLGKSTDLSTDINTDGITNTVDYMLALYSLGNNISNDTVSLKFIPLSPSPTPTTAPTATATPIPTNIPSPIPTATNTPTPTVEPSPTPTQAPNGICHTIPGSMARSICGVPEQDVSSSSDYGTCAGPQSSNPFCTGTKSKGKCTCPSGLVCVCQLKDTPTQTIHCTNGGVMDIVQCN